MIDKLVVGDFTEVPELEKQTMWGTPRRRQSRRVANVGVAPMEFGSLEVNA